MPDVKNIFYWYGWKTSQVEFYNTANGWSCIHANPYWMDIYNGGQFQTNRAYWAHPAKSSGGYISGIKLKQGVNHVKLRFIGYSNSDMQIHRTSSTGSKYLDTTVAVRQLGNFSESLRSWEGDINSDLCLGFATGSAAAGYICAAWEVD